MSFSCKYGEPPKFIVFFFLIHVWNSEKVAAIYGRADKQTVMTNDDEGSLFFHLAMKPYKDSQSQQS